MSLKSKILQINVSFTAFPCPFSVLVIALFIYYTSVPAGTEARTEVK